MGPLVDIEIHSIEVSNDAGFNGYVNGDQLTVNAVIKNSGDELYSDGGQIKLYQVTGVTEHLLGSATTLNTLSPGATQTVQVTVDSTDFAASSYDSKFRVRISNLVAASDL